MEIDENNFKAYYKLGLAYDASENLSLATHNLFTAAKLAPQNAEIRQEYQRVSKKLEEEKATKKQEPNLWSGLFGKKKP